METFRVKYPSLQLEDKLLVEGGRDVMWGQAYTRRRRARDMRRAAERVAREQSEPATGG